MFALLVDRRKDLDRPWHGLIVFRPDGPGSAVLPVRQLPLRPAARVPDTRLPTLAGEAIRFTSEMECLGSPGAPSDSNDEVWIGTSEGLSRLDGRIDGADQIHGVPFVSAIAEDKSATSGWVGRAAVRLARTGFVKYTEADGLSNDLIRSVFEADDGELCVVTRRQLIHRFDGTRFTAVRPNLSKDRSPVEAAVPVLQDRAGEWWVPGEAGLYRFPRAARRTARSRPPEGSLYLTRRPGGR